MKKIVVTGGAGQIGSVLSQLIQQGALGPARLMVLEKSRNIPALEEIGISATADPSQAFEDADCIFFAGAEKGLRGSEEILKKNKEEYKNQASALLEVCQIPPLILVIANPCNTLAWLLWQSLPSFPQDRFHALVQLDQNQAEDWLSKKLGVKKVQNVSVWGNHSPSIVPGWTGELIEESWKDAWVKSVQERGEKVPSLPRNVAAKLTAQAAIQAMYNLIEPTPKGFFYSSALPSRGNLYGIHPNLVFSFPCRTRQDGSIEIVSGLNPIDWELAKDSEKELLEEHERILRI